MKLYRIARDMGREIGLDLLVVDHGGMRFTHPNFLQHESAGINARIFEANLATCRAIASQMEKCSIVDQQGRRKA